jgi:DNA polymerase V
LHGLPARHRLERALGGGATGGIVESGSESATRVSEKPLQGSVAVAIQVFIRTGPFRENDRQYSASLTVPIRPTADSGRIAGAAGEAARSMFRPGFDYAKAGVMLKDLQEAQTFGDQGELDMFGGQDSETATDPDRPALMQAMDAPNRRFGRGAVRIDRQHHYSDGQRNRRCVAVSETGSKDAAVHNALG